MWIVLARVSALFVLVVALIFSRASVARADSPITVSDSSLKVDFPKHMTFHLAAQSSAQINQIQLLVHFPATNSTQRLTPKFTPNTRVDTNAVWDLSSSSTSTVGGYLLPGATGEYNWHIEDAAGNKLDTPANPFRLVDNRVTWKELKNPRVIISWYAGDQAFGQNLFDEANKTLDNIENNIGATVDHPIQIWFYDRDFFVSALPPGQPEWVGGESFDDFNVVFVLAEQGNTEEAFRGANHEMTHQVIAESLKGPFKEGFPHWLNEGLAVYHQWNPPKMDDFLQAPFQRAIQSDTLFRLRSLDSNFPADPQATYVCYGESYSVVEFLIRQYGRDKMKQLFALFKSGASSDAAFQQAIGVDTDGLENLWRKSVGAKEKSYPKATATPGAVPTFSFSSADTPSAATPSSGGSTPTRIAQAETPVPAVTRTPAPQSSSGGGGLCGGLFGGFVLFGFGAWQIRRRSGRVRVL
jgi:hypothetical protein